MYFSLFMQSVYGADVFPTLFIMTSDRDAFQRIVGSNTSLEKGFIGS